MNASGDRKGKRLTGEDIELWHGVTRSVKPMRAKKRVEKRIEKRAVEVEDVPAPQKLARKAAMTAVAVAKPSPPPKAPPAIAPIEKRLKQKIARGTQTIDARLDLHGHSQAEAHDALYRFLRRAQGRGARVVLVITGKGGRASGGRGEGVLKRSVPMWLSMPEFRELVIGFDSAAISHGGEGALYVRVRKARD